MFFFFAFRFDGFISSFFIIIADALAVLFIADAMMPFVAFADFRHTLFRVDIDTLLSPSLSAPLMRLLPLMPPSLSSIDAYDWSQRPLMVAFAMPARHFLSPHCRFSPPPFDYYFDADAFLTVLRFQFIFAMPLLLMFY